jgi:30S ribosomal protein S31
MPEGHFYSLVERIQNLNINNMGRGDKKTRKGKISKGSYGRTRPRKKQGPLVPADESKTKAPKK